MDDAIPNGFRRSGDLTSAESVRADMAVTGAALDELHDKEPVLYAHYRSLGAQLRAEVLAVCPEVPAEVIERAVYRASCATTALLISLGADLAIVAAVGNTVAWGDLRPGARPMTWLVADAPALLPHSGTARIERRG